MGAARGGSRERQTGHGGLDPQRAWPLAAAAAAATAASCFFSAAYCIIPCTAACVADALGKQEGRR